MIEKLRSLIVCVLLVAHMGLGSTLQATSSRTPEINNLELSPNPFSPYSDYSTGGEGKGLRIAFNVDCPSTFFWLTIKIFNLQGNPVRTLIERSPLYTDAGDKFGVAKTEIWWDGKSDAEQYAKNGRYLVHIKVSDTEAETFSTEVLKTVVLIK